jgi:hypothetical protein
MHDVQSEMLALTDADDKRVRRYRVLIGHRHDAVGGAPFNKDVEFNALIAAHGNELLLSDVLLSWIGNHINWCRW